ncbi:tetraspanin-8-like [Solea senegalensis]|uniref:Tetraspanin-8-like n=1 Tax=Solea senegalensis TaxID=28829 RepID=A0AAV6PEJ5_SOLSE|nr:tetraspanin-8-like [Solea senegalensis]KAG7458335.1 tetraspanin-8-like [Solea senegalensis]
MAQVNTCLKRVFTIFNIFFAVVGGVIILLTILSQVLTGLHGGEEMEGRVTGLAILYGVGIVTLVIAGVGAYGAHRESKAALIVFLVCMVIGSLAMLRLGIPAAVARPQVERVLEDRFRSMVPLDKATEDVKDMADTLQTHMHCCGLFSYKDWEDEIPASCVCNQKEQEEGECEAISYMNLFQTKNKYIYSKPCFPMLMYYFLLILDIGIGIIFSLAILALLGMTLSSIMIHQMRLPRSNTLVMTVPAIFTTAPPKYQELHNPPGY